MQLDQQNVIISGGASGLGEATARRFAAAGARVALLDIDRAKGQSVADEIGGVFVDCDVGNGVSAQNAIDAVVDAMGLPRVLVTCAGIGAGRRVVGRHGPHDAELFERVVRVNLTGTFHLLRLAAWRMSGLEPVDASGERGVIVTTSSIAAYDGVDGGVAYSASKAGVAGMTLPLARDLAPHGIRAVSIAPGSFETPLVAGMPPAFRSQLANETPFPQRFGAPSEFAALAEHVVSNPMINGEVIRLDGGLRMRPTER